MIAGIIITGVATFLGLNSVHLDLGEFAERDIFEESGRELLFEVYKNYVFENLLVGADLGEASGKIKSELSYLNIILFSGIGAQGFAVFFSRGCSHIIILTVKYNSGGWTVAVFVYIVISSIFEGYAASVSS